MWKGLFKIEPAKTQCVSDWLGAVKKGLFSIYKIYSMIHSWQATNNKNPSKNKLKI